MTRQAAELRERESKREQESAQIMISSDIAEKSKCVILYVCLCMRVIQNYTVCNSWPLQQQTKCVIKRVE